MTFGDAVRGIVGVLFVLVAVAFVTGTLAQAWLIGLDVLGGKTWGRDAHRTLGGYGRRPWPSDPTIARPQRRGHAG